MAHLIRRILTGQDHRDIIIDAIDGLFVSDVVQFFEQIVHAKLGHESISTEWYRNHFLDHGRFDKDELAWNGGLNVKTISNKRKSTRREIVVEEAIAHHDKFLALVDELQDSEIDVDLSLTLRDVTVHLNLNESLVVINVLAVRRAALRGGVWSTAGKQVEGPLMEVLCRLFGVHERHFTQSLENDGSLREVDFYLHPPQGESARCEVKLMGQGNPESADAVIARDSRVFVASTLSATNKTQLNNLGVLWTELQVRDGFLRFAKTLESLGIPHTNLDDGVDHSDKVDRAINETLNLAS